MRNGRVIGGAVVAIALGLVAAWLTRATPQRGNDVGSGASSSAARSSNDLPAPVSHTSGSAPKVAGSTTVRASKGQPVDPSSAPLERDPRRPGYDAARMFGLRMDGAKLIFESEPRDETWARQRESDITESSLKEFKQIDPNVQMEVECRTGTCRVRIHSRNSYLTDAMSFYPLQCLAQFAQPDFGNSTSIDPNAEDPSSDFYLIFGDATRSSDGFATQRANVCPKYRDKWFQKAPAR